MRISDWSSDVCSSDLTARAAAWASGPEPAESPGGLGWIPEPGRGGRLRDPRHRVTAAAEIEPRQRLYGLRRSDRQDVAQCRQPCHQRCWLGGWGSRRLPDRQSGVEGKSVSVSVDLGGCGYIKKKNNKNHD